ncbi:MAG TPA: TPM domain-containing protein, partial [Candidatus Acidoferrales bacterium]|nr:TPM domain-containing protein [Candidatus Acidoferrales bacterium]
MIAAIALAAAGFSPPPVPSQYVTDVAGALTPGAISEVTTRLQRYERATGHQIVVWIGRTTGDVPLETWTTQTADRWKIGRKGYDDGAVLFVFMQDHQARIEVGYGLESRLTDAASFRIIHDVLIPKMRAGDVDGAIEDTVAAMMA